MRILIAHSFYRLPGGEDRYVTQQLELLGRSHEVELLSARNDALTGGLATARRMMFSGSRLASVEDTIRRFGPDVVHMHNTYPAFGPAVHLAATRVGVPLAMTVHNYRLRCPNGFMYTEGNVCRRCETGVYVNATLHRCFPSTSQAVGYAAALWTHRFVFRLEKRVSLFVVPSQFVSGQLLRWGFDPARVRLIRNFTDAPVASTSVPGSFGVSVGRLSPEKGLDVLLRALRLAGDPPFVVIGDGPQRRRLERLAAELGLGRLTFRGRVSAAEVRTTFERARFAAFPSLWHENAPLAALEAMAAGRPLVVTSRGGLPELAGGGRGVVCAPGDAEDLAAKIILMSRDDALCARAGEAALAFARDELDPKIHLSRLEDAYAAVRAAPIAHAPAQGAERP